MRLLLKLAEADFGPETGRNLSRSVQRSHLLTEIKGETTMMRLGKTSSELHVSAIFQPYNSGV